MEDLPTTGELMQQLDKVVALVEDYKRLTSELQTFYMLYNVECRAALEMIGRSWSNEDIGKGEHYVYLAFDDRQLVYVGSGKGKRIEHVASGASHNRELNRYYFAGVSLNVHTLMAGVTKEKATEIEYGIIRLMAPFANSASSFHSTATIEHGSLYKAWQNGALTIKRVKELVDDGFSIY